MAASVLHSTRAIEVSVFIVRAFVKLRSLISEHKELSNRITQLEQHIVGHDQQIDAILQAIKELMNPEPPPKKRRIGFKVEKS